MQLVPDTSVLIDGRITELVTEGEYAGAEVLVPLAALAELEAQANRGQETGFAGLEELRALQRLGREGTCTVRLVGRRPTPEEVSHAEDGAIDALIRDAAAEHQATFVTSDRVQAYAASAQGLTHIYQRPLLDEAPGLEQLKVWSYFTPETMSVHLKADCRPMAKTGTPGAITYAACATKEIGHKEVRGIARECIEFAKRDYHSFVEMQKPGCTVLQLGPMRITIAQPPFSDALEMTAVRPITKTTLEDYDLPDGLVERIEDKRRGVFVAGSPGGGKSTFVAAIGEHLHAMNRVVKTMEQPRDLQVPHDVTQYGALGGRMADTGEVMLLVRPDHVLYDEVRTTDDFRVFADMRLAGIGLFGVTHANRPIDAIQRLVGRVELGMIPQVVDTVVYIHDGKVEAVLEVDFTVRVPAGMTEADLARPVVVVRDVLTREELFELYTYGEQVVVMPLDQVAGAGGPGGEARSGAAGLAVREIKRTLSRYARGPMWVEVHGNRATVRVPQHVVPQLIGKGGRTVQALESRLGIRLDIQADDSPGGPAGPGALTRFASRGEEDGAGRAREEGSRRSAAGSLDDPPVKATGSNVFLLLGPTAGGKSYRVEVEGAVIGEALAASNGRLRFKATSPEGQALKAAQKAGADIRVTLVSP